MVTATHALKSKKVFPSHDHSVKVHTYISVDVQLYTTADLKGPRPALLIKGDTLTAVIVQRSLQVYKPLLVGRCVRVGVSVHPRSSESLVHVSFCMIYLVSS